MPDRKICLVTGSRADYGLMYWIMKEVQQRPDMRLQIAATGMHLSPEFGQTIHFIEEDGFVIDERVESLLSGDSPAAVSKAIGLGVIGFADAFQRLRPDVVVLLGDRFEIFAAAQAALISKTTLAHIAGGDTTEGAFDEALRHGMTKMAHCHFVTNELSAKRVRQMGEDPAFIFNVGSPGLDYVKRSKLLGKSELEEQLGIRFLGRNFLVTFHPATLEVESANVQFAALLDALRRLADSDTSIVFTSPNADTGGRELALMIKEFVSRHPHASFFSSLGHTRYLSLMGQSDVIIGNSSSGLYEAPSFKKPSVNIGDRQKGRLQADSVVNCAPQPEEIIRAVHIALEKDCSKTVNPYGSGDSARQIVDVLARLRPGSPSLKKHFFDL